MMHVYNSLWGEALLFQFAYIVDTAGVKGIL